jgi:hypothetical protein
VGEIILVLPLHAEKKYRGNSDHSYKNVRIDPLRDPLVLVCYNLFTTYYVCLFGTQIEGQISDRTRHYIKCGQLKAPWSA